MLSSLPNVGDPLIENEVDYKAIENKFTTY